MDKNITEIQKKNTTLENQNKDLSSRVASLEKAPDEAVKENTEYIILKIASDIGSDLQLSAIDRNHRVRKPDADRTRPREIIVKFTSYRARQKLYKMRTELKAKAIAVFF